MLVDAATVIDDGKMASEHPTPTPTQAGQRRTRLLGRSSEKQPQSSSSSQIERRRRQLASYPAYFGLDSEHEGCISQDGPISLIIIFSGHGDRAAFPSGFSVSPRNRSTTATLSDTSLRIHPNERSE